MISLFLNLFKGEKKLSKNEYWKKWELSELLLDLYLARKLLDSFMSRGETYSVQEFEEDLSNEISELEHWNGSPISDFIYESFSPEGKWTEYETSTEGENARKRIFERIKRWKEATGYRA